MPIKEGLTAIPISGDEPSVLGRHWQQSEGAGVHRAGAWWVQQTLLLPSEQAAPCVSTEAMVRTDRFCRR